MARKLLKNRRRFAALIGAVLKKESMTQAQLAAVCNVDQPLISRLLNSKLHCWSRRVERVEWYVNMQLNDKAVPKDAANAVRAYLSSGGQLDVLCDAIGLLARASRGS